MKNKIKIITALIISLSILLSGCINNDGNNDDQSDIGSIETIPPISQITAPDLGFFGKEIEISAKKSYDPDGNIITYNWIFGDNQTDEGVTITHIFEQNYDITKVSFPVKFEVTLEIIDNDNLVNYSVHYIDLYPEKYQYYMTSNNLVLEKPSSDFDTLKASLGIATIYPTKEYAFKLNNPVILYPCDWTVTIYIEKPIITLFNKLSLSLYNKTNEVIYQSDVQYFELHYT